MRFLSRVSLAVFLAVLLLALIGPAALAQDGTGDRLVFGENYVLAAGQQLNGNLAVFMGNATLESGSLVQGDVAVFGGSLTVAGAVRGRVAVFGGAVSLADTAVVQGDLAVLGGSLERAPGARVSGEVWSGLRSGEGRQLWPQPELPGIPEPVRPEAPRVTADTPGGVLGFLGRILRWEAETLAFCLFLAFLGVLAVAFAPKAMARIASTAATEPAVSFGVGLLSLVVALFGGLLLLLACGLGLLVWLIVSLAWLVGWLAVGLWIGQRLLRAFKARQPSALVEVAVGVILITVLARLPWCIGFLAGLIVGCIGLGAVVLTRFGTQASSAGGRTVEGAAPQPGLPAPAARSQVTLDEAIVDSTDQPIEQPTDLPGTPLEQPAAWPDEIVTDAAGSLPQVQVFDDEPLPLGPLPAAAVVAPDDLERIIGIGPVFAGRLRAAGIATYAELAAADPSRLGPLIGVTVERIVREDWVGQAQALIK